MFFFNFPPRDNEKKKTKSITKIVFFDTNSLKYGYFWCFLFISEIFLIKYKQLRFAKNYPTKQIKNAQLSFFA